MKRKKNIYLFFLIISIYVNFTFLTALIATSSFYINKDILNSYQDDSSYLIVDNVTFEMENTYDLNYIFVAKIPTKQGFCNAYLTEDNIDIAKNYGLMDEYKEQKFTVIYYSKIQFDGDRLKIVAVYNDDKEYLDYQIGKNNLINEMVSSYENSKTSNIVFMILFIIFLIPTIVFLVLYIKEKIKIKNKCKNITESKEDILYSIKLMLDNYFENK